MHVFGYTKVRYRGIVKNHHWHLVAFALVNLYQYRKRLASPGRSISRSTQRPPKTSNKPHKPDLFINYLFAESNLVRKTPSTILCAKNVGLIRASLKRWC
jgi:hypothetical protein